MFSQKKSTKPEAVALKPAAPSIISSDLSINGNLNSGGDIQVDGTVEGDIVSKKLTVSSSGVVRGAIEAETVWQWERLATECVLPFEFYPDGWELAD